MNRLPPLLLPGLDRNKRTYVMGILNVTPDSFSDGGRFIDKDKAVERSLALVGDGADILDIGGESTRPGSRRISVEEELSRVIPVILGVRKRARIPISIDTMKASVAEEAIRSGASIVNDVSGLKFDKDMASVVAKYSVWLIITHMKGMPENMQARPRYKNVVKDIIRDLRVSLSMARKAGVADDKIIIDPGIGFGKTFEQNLEILNALEEFKTLKRPICIGTSRKAFIGTALGIKDPRERLIGTIATCVAAIMKGASMIRVHDVKEASQAARMTDSILRMGAN